MALPRYNDYFAETESWQAAHGKILALETLATPDHDLLLTGGNDSLVSFWSGKTRSDHSGVASARSNGERGRRACSSSQN